MYPQLPKIFGYALSTYALCCALAMGAALIPIRKEARRMGWNVEAITWLVFSGTLVAWIGAHLLYVLTRLDLPAADLWHLLPRIGSGSVWYGGFITAWAYVHLHAKRNGLEPYKLYDVMIFGTMVAHAVGRIGCLMGGCCYGSQTSLPWGLANARSEYGNTPLHPVPLYEALYTMALFVLLWSKRTRQRAGISAVSYLGFSAVGRFGLEFLRGDHIRGFIIGSLSTSQFIALLMFVAAALLWLSMSNPMTPLWILLRARRTQGPRSPEACRAAEDVKQNT